MLRHMIKRTFGDAIIGHRNHIDFTNKESLMRTLRFVSAVAASVVLATTTFTCGQDHSAEGGHADMEKMWAEYATPGAEHEAFKSMVGTWKTVTKDFMTNPQNPTITEGSAKFELALGGRFLRQTYRSTFEGRPFEGEGLTGFDKSTKKYVGSWIDNMGTGIMNTVGEFDAATKTMTETSEMSSPMGPMKVKLVTQHKSDNEFVFTMYMTSPQGEMKSMEITYTRS